MEIICESCKAKLNIPDEKLPQGQRVSVKCPRCKNKLILDTTPAKPDVPDAADHVIEKSDIPGHEIPGPPTEEAYESAPFDEIPGIDDVEADSALDFYEEGETLALVMNTDAPRSEKIKAALDELGYATVWAENTQEAVSKMRFQNFDLVILSDLFDDTPLEKSPILQFLNHLSISVRRKIFLLLMGDTFKTMDHLTAFAMSANLVANWKDLDSLANILRRAISDNERFYKVFMDTLKETGKA
ncbi:MAG: zinc-ribbon domain-containing protein [Deltaproteobacteria bacterium]|nr:zinc-ribbon domain-containing protein [Deltaproteobacteria bacterium]